MPTTTVGWKITIPLDCILAPPKLKSCYSMAFSELSSFKFSREVLPLAEDLEVVPSDNGYVLMHSVPHTPHGGSLEQQRYRMEVAAIKVCSALRHILPGVAVTWETTPTEMEATTAMVA